MDAKEIVRRFRKLESERNTIEGTWELIKQFIAPYRGEFYGENIGEEGVDWKNRELYDSTAIRASNVLASSLHGSLTSPAYKWFSLRFRNDDFNSNKEAKAWLEDTENRLFTALQQSNFNLEANECYLDLVHFGTSVIVEEIVDGEIVFKTIPTKECYFEMDANGGVCALYRRFKYTPVQIVDKFGREKVPEDIVNKAESSNSNERIDVIYAITKRNLGEKFEYTGPVAAEKRPYEAKYVLTQRAEDIGDIQGYYEMPAFVPRWRSTSESKFGNSPAMVALPDVLTLNELYEMFMRALEKVVDPATLTTERGLLSDLDLSAGGLTVVRDVKDLVPFESRARFDVTQMSIQDLRVSIREAFYVDQLELKNSPAMTATEVSVRYELMQRLLGPTLGRLENDFLSPLIERTFNIMLRDDKLAPLPDVLADSGAGWDIRYTGPLARSQRIDQAAAVERWLGTVGALAEIKPEALDIVNEDEIARDMADVLNVPARYTNSKEQIESARRARAQQQAQMQAAQLAQEQGKAAEAVGKGQAAMGGGNA